MLQIKHLGIKNWQYPVSQQNQQVQEDLELTIPSLCGMIQRIIIEQ